MNHRFSFAVAVIAAALSSGAARAADWPMYGRDATRNAVSPEKGPPTNWQVELRDDAGRVTATARNIKWTASLGSTTLGAPVVSGGLVWVCTNNEGRRDPNFTKDAGCLMCFNEADGKFRWQHVTPRVGERVHDWPGSSSASPPLVEGERLWFVTNRWEVVCLDIGPLLKGTGEPREVWKLDMPRDLGVFGKCPSMAFNLRCAIGSSYKGMIYVITGNGVDESYKNVPAPDAPALVCLDKDSGKVLWKDNSPGQNILETQCASPLVAEVNGRVQVIAPQGDGWVRSFDARTGKLIWKFDANPKGSVYPQTRNELVAPPVLYEGRVYVATGQSIEHGVGPAILWCIDPTKQGDVSEEMEEAPPADAPAAEAPADDAAANARRVGPRRGKPNPNSAAVWKFDQVKGPDGKARPQDRMYRSAGSVAAAGGLVIAADLQGYVHCLDARTGEHLWAHDTETDVYGSPLICDGKVYVGDGDGCVRVLALAREEKLLARREFGQAIYCSPVFANGVLYVATRDTLYAIREHRATPAADATESEWPQWRGPDRTNVARDARLLGEWPDGGPPLLWRAAGLGEGVPSVAVAGGRAYTLGYRQEAEFLTAWDAETGRKAWDARIGPAVAEMRHMRWLSQRTPTVDGDRVYVVTARGELVCLGTRGTERWRKNYAADFGGRPGSWGYCDYPLVDGDRLVCTPGGKDASVVALDKQTGALLWKCAVPGSPRATYAGMIAAEVAGVRQYVQQFETGVAGIGTDGKVLWKYDALRNNMGTVHTAIQAGDDAVFCSMGWGLGGALVRITRDGAIFTASEVHRGNPRAFEGWMGNSSLLGRHVYTNNGYCIDPRTGEVAWAARLGSRITMVVADWRLYYRLTDGTMVLAEANPAQYVERGRFQPPRAAAKEPAWSSPVIAGGRLYLRDQDELLCYDLRRERGRDHDHDRPPDLPKTGPAGETTAATAPPAAGATGAPTTRRVGHDAIFVPTPQDVTERMLELAAVRKADVVYDLGCGDGRIVVTAARKYGCRAVGVDIDPECVRLSRENAGRHKVRELVRIEQRDLFDVDLGEASVVALYVGRDVNRRLVPQLKKLKPGSRVVSHNFEIEGYAPEKVVDVLSTEDDTRHTIYLYRIPLKPMAGG